MGVKAVEARDLSKNDDGSYSNFGIGSMHSLLIPSSQLDDLNMKITVGQKVGYPVKTLTDGDGHGT